MPEMEPVGEQEPNDIAKVVRRLFEYNNLLRYLADGEHSALSPARQLVEMYEQTNPQKAEEKRLFVKEIEIISTNIRHVRDSVGLAPEESIRYFDQYADAGRHLDQLSDADEHWLRNYAEKVDTIYNILTADPYNYSDNQLGVVKKAIEDEDEPEMLI